MGPFVRVVSMTTRCSSPMFYIKTQLCKMQNLEERNFILRPAPEHKFRPSVVLPLVKETVADLLSGRSYVPEEADDISSKLSHTIRTKIKSLQLPRYKFIIQVYIAEQVGQGMTTATQSIWDEDCDSFVNYRYANSSIWCQVIVYAVFHY